MCPSSDEFFGPSERPESVVLGPLQAEYFVSTCAVEPIELERTFDWVDDYWQERQDEPDVPE